MGDLSLLQDQQLANEIRSLISANSTDKPELTVRIGLFYSSYQ